MPIAQQQLDDIPEDAELLPEAVPYFEAWWLLSPDRPLGAMGGESRIPWQSVRLHADEYGFDRETLARLLGAMDEVYLTWLAEKQKAESKGNR